MKEGSQKRFLRDVAFMLPLLATMLVGFVPMTRATMDLWLSVFIVSVSVAIPFSIDLLYLTRGKDFLPTEKPRSLGSSQSGIVWVWVVAALTIGMVAMVWWVVSYPLFLIIEAYAAAFTTPPEIAPLLDLILRVIVWFLGIVVAGVIIWALVSSYQGERQTYPGTSPYFG